jgi:DNA replication protein DnaC
MEQEVSVRMTNFATILNDLSASVDGRNGYIERLCAYPLLILDDFGMERGTEYGLEQVYNVVDSRYRSGRPLIVTTNLTLDSLQNPEDTAHARIYDRLLEMCVPVRFTGGNFRKITAQEKMERVKKMMEEGKANDREE